MLLPLAPSMPHALGPLLPLWLFSSSLVNHFAPPPDLQVWECPGTQPCSPLRPRYATWASLFIPWLQSPCTLATFTVHLLPRFLWTLHLTLPSRCSSNISMWMHLELNSWFSLSSQNFSSSRGSYHWPSRSNYIPRSHPRQLLLLLEEVNEFNKNGKYKLQKGTKISGISSSWGSPQVSLLLADSDGDLGHKIWEKVWLTIGLSLAWSFGLPETDALWKPKAEPKAC